VRLRWCAVATPQHASSATPRHAAPTLTPGSPMAGSAAAPTERRPTSNRPPAATIVETRRPGTWMLRSRPAWCPPAAECLRIDEPSNHPGAAAEPAVAVVPNQVPTQQRELRGAMRSPAAPALRWPVARRRRRNGKAAADQLRRWVRDGRCRRLGNNTLPRTSRRCRPTYATPIATPGGRDKRQSWLRRRPHRAGSGPTIRLSPAPVAPCSAAPIVRLGTQAEPIVPPLSIRIRRKEPPGTRNDAVVAALDPAEAGARTGWRHRRRPKAVAKPAPGGAGSAQRSRQAGRAQPTRSKPTSQPKWQQFLARRSSLTNLQARPRHLRHHPGRSDGHRPAAAQACKASSSN